MIVYVLGNTPVRAFAYAIDKNSVSVHVHAGVRHCMHVSVSVSECVSGNVSAISLGCCWLLSLFHFSIIILSKFLLVGSGE